MKKLFSLILAVCFAMMLSVSAFAAEPDTSNVTPYESYEYSESVARSTISIQTFEITYAGSFGLEVPLGSHGNGPVTFHVQSTSNQAGVIYLVLADPNGKILSHGFLGSNGGTFDVTLDNPPSGNYMLNVTASIFDTTVLYISWNE